MWSKFVIKTKCKIRATPKNICKPTSLNWLSNTIYSFGKAGPPWMRARPSRLFCRSSDFCGTAYQHPAILEREMTKMLNRVFLCFCQIYRLWVRYLFSWSCFKSSFFLEVSKQSRQVLICQNFFTIFYSNLSIFLEKIFLILFGQYLHRLLQRWWRRENMEVSGNAWFVCVSSTKSVARGKGSWVLFCHLSSDSTLISTTYTTRLHTTRSASVDPNNPCTKPWMKRKR